MSGKPTVEEMLQKIGSINRVEGFDPTPFAVEYTDMNTGESRKRLPVMIQMAWFRLKYPEGRIAVGGEAPPGTASWPRPGSIPATRTARSAFWRKPPPPVARTRPAPRCLPGSGPRPPLWASPCATPASACNFTPLGTLSWRKLPDELGERPQGEPEPEPTYEVREPTPEEKLRQAQSTPCPIAKYSGKTLGEVLTLDP